LTTWATPYGGGDPRGFTELTKVPQVPAKAGGPALQKQGVIGMFYGVTAKLWCRAAGRVRNGGPTPKLAGK